MDINYLFLFSQHLQNLYIQNRPVLYVKLSFCKFIRQDKRTHTNLDIPCGCRQKFVNSPSIQTDPRHSAVDIQGLTCIRQPFQHVAFQEGLHLLFILCYPNLSLFVRFLFRKLFFIVSGTVTAQNHFASVPAL